MKIFISTEKYYEQVLHQKEETVFFNSIIQQHKRDNPSKTDYAGDLQPKEMIKLNMKTVQNISIEASF